MTANQIANASNQIQQQAVDENARHNNSVEEETKRHNLVLEDLQRRQLDLQGERDYWEAWYKQESTALQKEYNRAYLEWQRAQGEQKLKIEQQLAWIEQQKANADESYKFNILRIQDTNNEIQKFLAEEKKRNNEALESLEATKLDYSNTLNLLKAKELEYQRTYWNASIDVQKEGLLVTQQRDLNNYSLGLLNLQHSSNALQLQTLQYQLDLERWKTETKFKGANLGIDLFNTTANTVLKMWGFGNFWNK